MSSSSPLIAAEGTPFIILGADAVLAALPASPVQLAHACQALGFELAAPATWGDELIAESCLDQLVGYEHPAAVMCSCPLVTERLTRSSDLLEPFMLTFTSPPVATARYLRAAFSGQTLHITYAGSCPGADDDSIDARLRPSQLLEAFVEHGIVVGAQPNQFDALVPLDRRRFYSMPGGTPSREQVERSSHRELIELAGDDIMLELSQQLIEQTPALIDLAMPLGCACAGAGEHSIRGAHGGLLTLEPPRARQRVIDQSVQVHVSQTLAEACALEWIAAEEPTELEVVLAADSAPVHDDVRIEIGDIAIDVAGTDVVIAAPLEEIVLVDVIDAEAELEFIVAITGGGDVVEAVTEELRADAPAMVQESVGAEAIAESIAEEAPADVHIEATEAPRRRQILGRASASLPRHANANGELVPRASLAVMRRALARIAKRKAKRQPKPERGRRERAMEIHDGLVRTTPRTPRSLAIPAAADLPRPVPPPPAPVRYRPRAPLEM
jgi:hypothetical protein